MKHDLPDKQLLEAVKKTLTKPKTYEGLISKQIIKNSLEKVIINFK